MSGIVATSTGPTAFRFSYAAVTPEAEAIARSAAEAIRSVTSRFISEIGQHLLAAKDALPHGAFTAWAKAELAINARTARNYMSAAQWLEGKPATVSVLPPTIIYTLARPDTPSELIDDVVAMGQAGEVDLGVVREKLDRMKVEQFDLRIARRRNPKLTAAELRERKTKQRQQAEREREREHAERGRDRDERRRRLQPLATCIGAFGPATVEQMLAVLKDYRDQQALTDLLHDLVAAAQPVAAEA